MKTIWQKRHDLMNFPNGTAGIASGAKLLENGINNIILLEAEDRIGGRIHTVSFGENNIDLGAQWCHGRENNIVYQMAGNDGVFDITDHSAGKMTFVRSDGAKVDGKHCERLMNLCTSILENEEDLATVQGSIGDCLVEKYREAIKKPEFNGIDPELLVEILEVFQKNECSFSAADTTFDLSAYGYTKYKQCPGPLRLNWKEKGYQTIIDYVTVSLSSQSRHQSLSLLIKIFIRRNAHNRTNV